MGTRPHAVSHNRRPRCTGTHDHHPKGAHTAHRHVAWKGMMSVVILDEDAVAAQLLYRCTHVHQGRRNPKVPMSRPAAHTCLFLSVAPASSRSVSTMPGDRQCTLTGTPLACASLFRLPIRCAIPACKHTHPRTLTMGTMLAIESGAWCNLDSFRARRPHDRLAHSVPKSLRAHRCCRRYLSLPQPVRTVP